MADETIKALAVEISMDDASFAQGKASLLNQMKVIDSEFKSSIAGVKNWGSSLDALKGNATALGDKINVQKQIIQAYSDQLGKSNTALDKNSQKVTDNKVKFDAAKVAYEESTTALGKNADETKALKAEMDKAESALKSSEGLVRSNNKAVQDSTVGYNNATGSLSKMESELSQTNAKIADSTSKLTKMEASLTSVGKGLEGAGKKATSAGKALTVGLTAPIAAIGVAAANAGMNFEAEMSRVQAIAEASGEDLNQLSAQALQLGADTSFSATQAATGMENLASAGFTTKEIMSAMPGMLDLAASSGADLASSADIASSTLRGFNLAASEAGHVADVLAKNAAQTNAAVTDTGLAMKYIAPVAQSAGWSLESVTAAIGEMANAGIKGEQAGTTLRGTLVALEKPSSMATSAMKDIGFSAYDAQGKMKPLSQIVSELNDKTSKLTDQQRDNTLATILGTESLSGMKVLLKDGSKGLDTMTKSLKTSDGAAKAMAKTMLNNAKGSIEQMNGSLETAGITASKSFAPIITKVAEKVTELANDFSKLTPAQQESIVKTLALTAAAGPALTIVGKLGEGVGGLFATTGKAIGGIKDFTSGLKGIAPIAGETIGVAGKVGTALSAIGGGPTLLAIAAVAVGIGLIATACANSKTENEKLIESIDTERASWEELKKTSDKKAGTDLALIGRTQDLWKEMQTVVDKNGKIKSGYQDRVKFISGELNSALGTEIKVNGSVVTSYNDISKSIDNLIAKKRAQILLEAHEQDYKKALLEYQKKEQEQTKLSIELVGDKNEATKQKMKVDKLDQEGSLAKADYERGIYNEEVLRISDKQTAYDKNEGFLLDYYKTIGSYEGASAASSKGNYADVEKALSSVTVAYTVATGATKKQLEDQALNANVALSNMRKRLSEHADGVTVDMVNKAGVAATKANEEFLKVGNNAGKGIVLGLDSQGALIYTSGANAGNQVVSGANSVDYAKYGSSSGSAFGTAFGTAIKSTKLPQIKVNWVTESKSSQSNAGKLASYSFPNIRWAANGGVFDKAEVIGIGERGREAALPLNNTIFMEIAQGIIKNLKFPSLNSLTNAVSQPRVANASYSAPTTSTASQQVQQAGDTITIISNRPLSPAETIRQLRHAKQQLALGR